MKKTVLLVVAFIQLTRLATAQSFDPVLAAKLQNTIDSMRTAQNLKGISACVVVPGMGA